MILGLATVGVLLKTLGSRFAGVIIIVIVLLFLPKHP